MATIRVRIDGLEDLSRRLGELSPERNRAILRGALIESAGKIGRNAAQNQIVAGGRGKGSAVKPLPSKLTSRTGTLRGSIRVDRGPLPIAIEVGTDLKYGAVHEFGGSVDVPSVVVKEHRRRVVFGRRVPEFTVPPHLRMGHTANYPKRPFMKPALDFVAPKIPAIFVKYWRREAKL